MIQEERKIEIYFEDATLAERGIKASNLRDHILENFSDVKIDIKKEDPTTQDLGTILVLILGAPAVVAIARGIADYLRRDRGKITITKDGTVVAEGLSGDDAARITEAMSKK